MASKTAQVKHLGGITVSYRATELDRSKPTLVLLHSFMTSSGLYEAQFESSAITDATNLIAVDLLGHGQTKVDSGNEQFTYWDSAIMTLQLLDELKVDKFFALGTSQGGWIVMRLALLAPQRVSVSMDSSWRNEANTIPRFKAWLPLVHPWTMNLSVQGI